MPAKHLRDGPSASMATESFFRAPFVDGAMILTRKQRAVLRLRRAGFGPTAIASVTGLHRVTVSRLLSRAKRNLRRSGIDPDKILAVKDEDILELVA